MRTIGGTPATSIGVGEPYSFAPGASDPDGGDTSRFSITGTPDWASFNTVTGQLTGTPDTIHVGDLTIAGAWDLTVATGPGTAIGSTFCAPAATNVTGQPGALLVSGSELASSNDVTLAAYQLPPFVAGYFLASRGQGPAAMPGGSIGTLCLGAPIGRFDALVQGSGAAGQLVQRIDLTAIPFATGAQAAQAGETWSFQCWYRDTLVGLPTSNFTDAVSITFQ